MVSTSALGILAYLESMHHGRRNQYHARACYPWIRAVSICASRSPPLNEDDLEEIIVTMRIDLPSDIPLSGSESSQHGQTPAR